jgi:UDP-N-acetylmuramate dehydrogenase
MVIWNAWCFWLEAENNFLEAEIYNIKTWQIEFFNKEQMQFWYRDSFLKKNWVDYFLINVKFDLSKKVEKYFSNINFVEFRVNQPKWLTCWSFFKNPSKENPSGKLIEEVWLKWYKIWWAFFSPIHANFLMSDWTATYKDLLDLIELAIKKVKEEKEIVLEPEVRIIFN